MVRRRRKRALATLLGCAALALGATACEMADDNRYYNQLDKLRVLGVKSEPAALLPGEEATLSALVYAPEDAPVRYAWSWCPARESVENGLACAVEEEELQAIWASLGTGESLPPYDLGDGETATFPHVFDESVALALCAGIINDPEATDDAILSCLIGLRPSVRLQVSTSDDEVVAVRNLTLLFDEDEAEDRNTNPDPSGPLEIEDGAGETLEAGAPLTEKSLYTLTASFGEEQAQSFLPEPEPGPEPPSRRRETLFMRWFVTAGTTLVGEDATDSTSWVDGFEFEELLKNSWALPVIDEVPGGEVRLYLVLRDERGGVGWAEYRFALQGAP